MLKPTVSGQGVADASVAKADKAGADLKLDFTDAEVADEKAHPSYSRESSQSSL